MEVAAVIDYKGQADRAAQALARVQFQYDKLLVEAQALRKENDSMRRELTYWKGV